MEFKGTKGKWIVRYEKNSNGFVNIDLPNKRFITFYGKLKKINDVFPEETKANALLISKAPEMLEETQDTIDELKLLKSTIIEASKTNNKLESVAEVIQNWIDRKEQLIKEATEL